jgi:hypothetical protein
MKAFLNGIPIYIMDPSESSDWEIETQTFITDHKTRVFRVKQGPKKFAISAFLLGKSASLLKDTLIKILEKEEPARLIHPLFGIQQVVCANYSVQSLDQSSNGFMLEMEFFEKGKPTQSQFSQKVLDLEAAATALAARFCQAFESLQELYHSGEKALQLAIGVRALLTCCLGGGKNLLVSLGAKAFDTLENLDPMLLFHEIKSGIFSMSEQNKISFLEAIQRLSLSKETLFIKDSMTALVFISEKSPSYDLGLDDLISRCGASVIPDTLFPFLWDLSLKRKTQEPQQKNTTHALPSLVVSYGTSGTLEKAMEIARGSGQPFYL